jgi:hypothetical protein
MRAAFAIAALAGSAIAAPSYGSGYGNPKEPVENVVVVVETVVKTVYVTEGYQIESSTSCSSSVVPAAATTSSVAPPAPTTTVVKEPAKPTYGNGYGVPSMPAYQPPAPSMPAYEPPAPVKPTPTPEAPKPTPTPQPSPEPQPAPPADAGYMGVVAKWRSKMGLKELTQSSKLEGTSMDTVKSSPGVMKHKLNSGVYGQVLADGGADEFEHVFLGGWLCEIPSLPGLDGACQQASNGWDYQGQTGHADILTNTQYTQIGCSNYDGVWCCDLAY